ncbi:MAG TPA: aminoacyl-tRNA hydrolase [Spirochaetota bacterium]|nr:aminoacyl-tRNA hydrolase [Spirochaetota bacterium]
MYLAVGLGNPGKQYSKNRHNAGFLFIDYLSKKYGFEDFKKKDNYYFSKKNYAEEEVIFLKPLTYMNLSGNAIVSAKNFFKIPTENIAIIYDDMDLDFGKIRIRKSGSSGGHNGLKSIENALGTNLYKRIKIGISSPNNSSEVIGHVLGDFSTSDITLLENDLFPIVDLALEKIIKNDIEGAMNKYNGNNNI